MATLEVTGRLKFSPSGANVEDFDTGLIKVSITTTSDNYQGWKTQAVGTSWEQVVLPADVASVGYIIVKNNDSTNFVSLADVTSGPALVDVGPKEIAIFELSSAALWALADTAAVNIQYAVFSV